MRTRIIPITEGRGAGLGNEILTWSKSFLAAEAIGGVAMPPAFGFNQRPYARYFGTPKYDWLLYRALRKITPDSHVFNEHAYLENFDSDFGVAFHHWHQKLASGGREPKFLFVEGMWGGYASQNRARQYLLGKLLSTRHTSENIAAKLPKASAEARLRVGLHYRSGDFQGEWRPGDTGGRWNRKLPMDWYLRAMRAFVDGLGSDIEFLLVTDATPAEAEPFIREFSPITTFNQRNTDISDMLLLSSCDVVIPSLSSFSLSAIWLGNPSYIWPYEHAINENGWLSFWGDEAPDTVGRRFTDEHVRRWSSSQLPASYRCLFFRDGTPLPAQFVAALREKLETRDISTDPLCYGVQRTD